MRDCLICGSSIAAFMSFGQMPIANGFLTPEQFESEYFYELKVGFCPECSMVQLMEQPKREMMFHGDYAFFSSTSRFQVLHFRDFSELVVKDYLSSDNPFVVELGSNDGIMLQNFAEKKIRHLGVEPSSNVAQVAIEKGINTISEFFDEDLAGKIVAEYGQADAILAANVMCHIPYLNSVAGGIKLLLKPGGVLMFEDPYLGDIVEKTSYDQIYDEHVFFFSVASIEHLFNEHGMEVFDIAPQNVHGGSMRYFISRRGEYPVSPAVEAQKHKEEELGLREKTTFETFRKNVEYSRDKLMEVLTRLKDEGKRVVGYGATSKSTTAINFCGITPDLVEFISDTTPTKQGKLSPGAHIPVKSYEAFCNNYPDVALLFAWNHGEEIIAKEGKFKQSGGKWLVYVPEVEIF